MQWRPSPCYNLSCPCTFCLEALSTTKATHRSLIDLHSTAATRTGANGAVASGPSCVHGDCTIRFNRQMRSTHCGVGVVAGAGCRVQISSVCGSNESACVHNVVILSRKVCVCVCHLLPTRPAPTHLPDFNPVSSSCIDFFHICCCKAEDQHAPSPTQDVLFLQPRTPSYIRQTKNTVKVTSTREIRATKVLEAREKIGNLKTNQKHEDTNYRRTRQQQQYGMIRHLASYMATRERPQLVLVRKTRLRRRIRPHNNQPWHAPCSAVLAVSRYCSRTWPPRTNQYRHNPSRRAPCTPVCCCWCYVCTAMSGASRRPPRGLSPLLLRLPCIA